MVCLLNDLRFLRLILYKVSILLQMNLQKSAYTLRIPVPGTAALPGARRSLHLLPLKVGQRGVGVLRLQVEGNSRWLSTEAHLDIEKGRANSRTAFFWTFLDQAATMIEQAYLRQQSMQVEVLRRTDALRTALLSSVSHDLRTPLASIKAAASSLLQEDMQWLNAIFEQTLRSLFILLRSS